MENMSCIFPDHSRLAGIPNEILLNVMTCMPDLTTLHNFVAAYPPSADLYRALYKRVLAGTLRQCEFLQIQKLACTIISIRHRDGLTGIDDINQYLDTHLEDKNTPLLIDDIIDPHSVLRDLALIAQDIEIFIASFVDRRLREPSTSLCSMHKPSDPSSAEIHRIRRAFWRLQLLCDLFRFRAEGTIPADYEDPPDHFYLEEYMNAWEVEEIECAYYHLHEQFGTFDLKTQKVPIQSQLATAQRLFINLGYGKQGLSAGVERRGVLSDRLIKRKERVHHSSFPVGPYINGDIRVTYRVV